MADVFPNRLNRFCFMKPFSRAMGALFVFAFLLGGCQTRSSDAPATLEEGAAATARAFPRDDLGREVPLREAAKRVVVLGPGAVEMAYALGASEKVVGRDEAADFPVAAKKVPVAGNFRGPNVEATTALAPDLVVLQGETWDDARVERWEKQIGAPVAVLAAKTLEEVGGDLQQLGAWLGASEKAREIAAPFEKMVASAAAAPRAFIDLGRSPALYTAGKGTLVGDVVESAGFQNAAKVQGYQAYNVEVLLANEPDFYVVPSSNARADELKALRSHPTLSKLKAVREGRVIVVHPDLVLRPGPRLETGLEKLRTARGAT